MCSWTTWRRSCSSPRRAAGDLLKTFAQRALLCGLSLLLGLAIVELGLRVLWVKRFTIASGIEHPHFHHRLKPSTVYHYYSPEFDVQIRTNRFGLRGPDPVIPKPAGTVRILMLGDSFTFGFPVKDDETFCHLIEQGLRQRGYPVDVVNGGVSGYSPTLEYVSLRDQFLTFQPDLVILWYDYGDLQEDYWFQKNLIYDAQGAIVRADPAYRNGRFDRWEWMKNHSALAKYADTKLLRMVSYIEMLGLKGYVAAKLRGERAKVAAARVKAAQQADDLPSHDRFFLIREGSTPEMLERYWSLSARYILMMRQLLAARSIPFILGTYPYGMAVGPDQWAKGRTFWGFEAGKVYDDSRVSALFASFCEREHIPLIATGPSFKAADRGGTVPAAEGVAQHRGAAADRAGKLYYDYDGHMTASGQRVLAQHVLQDPQLTRMLDRLRQQTGSKGVNRP